MRRAERLYRLVNEMRTRDVSRASELAAALEVSVSTIYRDIAHLQSSGVPIEGEAGVGYLLRPGFDLPDVTFTNDQVDALAIGLAFVERAGDPTLATAAREVRAKIQAGMPQPELRRLADAPYFSLQIGATGTNRAAMVREAVRSRSVLHLLYHDRDGTLSERVIQPLVVWNLTDGWMVSAWCRLREDFRSFRFDRISSLVPTGETFADEAAKDLRAFLAQDECR